MFFFPDDDACQDVFFSEEDLERFESMRDQHDVRLHLLDLGGMSQIAEGKPHRLVAWALARAEDGDPIGTSLAMAARETTEYPILYQDGVFSIHCGGRFYAWSFSGPIEPEVYALIQMEDPDDELELWAEDRVWYDYEDPYGRSAFDVGSVGPGSVLVAIERTQPKPTSLVYAICRFQNFPRSTFDRLRNQLRIGPMKHPGGALLNIPCVITDFWIGEPPNSIFWEDEDGKWWYKWGDDEVDADEEGGELHGSGPYDSHFDALMASYQ